MTCRSNLISSRAVSAYRPADLMTFSAECLFCLEVTKIRIRNTIPEEIDIGTTPCHVSCISSQSQNPAANQQKEHALDHRDSIVMFSPQTCDSFSACSGTTPHDAPSSGDHPKCQCCDLLYFTAGRISVYLQHIILWIALLTQHVKQPLQMHSPLEGA